MLPLSDGLPARRFPVVNVLLIAANFAVWILYELPHLNAAVYHASFYACAVDGACRAPEPWGLSWITAMFLHGSWATSWATCCSWPSSARTSKTPTARCATFCSYFAGGFAAMMAQAGMTLWFGTAADARAANLGASGAIAAVLGAYFVLYPGSRVTTWIFPVFLVKIPAWGYLGLWFLYQLVEADFGLFNARANGGGVAFFAHVGGFVFGLLVTRLLIRAGQVAPVREHSDNDWRPGTHLVPPMAWLARPRHAARGHGIHRRTDRHRCALAVRGVGAGTDRGLGYRYARLRLDKALTKAARVVKRTVVATTDEITSELQEALKS